MSSQHARTRTHILLLKSSSINEDSPGDASVFHTGEEELLIHSHDDNPYDSGDGEEEFAEEERGQAHGVIEDGPGEKVPRSGGEHLGEVVYPR